MSLKQPTVAVVVTTYNHAHFLPDALDSIFAQETPADEVIVVDDGSTDDPGAVVARYPRARLLAQRNQGLSAARNTGLAAAASEFVLFLDADDRLLPNAIGAGLAHHARHPGCALVYGAHRHISETGSPVGNSRYTSIGSDAYAALLQGNQIGMHATVLYQREALVRIGGFDISLPRCEDYDVYLRLARQSPIASHPDLVAEYRKHGNNMSGSHLVMLRWVLTVQGRHSAATQDPNLVEAGRVGQRTWKDYYAGLFVQEARANAARPGLALAALAKGVRASPTHVLRLGSRGLIRQLARTLPPSAQKPLRRLFRFRPLPGGVRFGDLGGTSPIDGEFGYGRGSPVDRLYIEEFLERHRTDIRGRVLEVGDDAYSRRFGGSQITQQDILHVHAGNPAATIVGDLAMPGVLPAESFDCIVLTQTLHLLFDLHGAAARLYDALRPGGVLLVTVPGLSQVDRNEWAATWYWALTPAAATRLFGLVFPSDGISVESHGNVFAATCFLQGIAHEEVPRAKLMVHDPAYPLIVTVRACKTRPDEPTA